MKVVPNNWFIYNSMIFKLYSMDDLYEMREKIMELFNTIVPYDSAISFISKNGRDLEDPMIYGFRNVRAKKKSQILDITDYRRWYYIAAKNKAFRVSYLFDDGMRLHDQYYMQGILPKESMYSLHASMSYNNIFVGGISIYRNEDKGDFTDEEELFMDCLKSHLALKLYKEFHGKDLTGIGSKKINVKFEDIIKIKYDLTNRETEVLFHMTKGLANSDISDKLVISENTLKKYITKIYAKTKVKNRRELINLIAGEEDMDI